MITLSIYNNRKDFLFFLFRGVFLSFLFSLLLTSIIIKHISSRFISKRQRNLPSFFANSILLQLIPSYFFPSNNFL